MGATGGGRKSWGAGGEGLKAELEDVLGQLAESRAAYKTLAAERQAADNEGNLAAREFSFRAAEADTLLQSLRRQVADEQAGCEDARSRAASAKAHSESIEREREEERAAHEEALEAARADAQSASDAADRTLAGVREEAAEAGRRVEEEVVEHMSSLAEALRRETAAEDEARDAVARAEKAEGEAARLRMEVALHTDHVRRLEAGTASLRTDLAASEARLSELQSTAGGESPHTDGAGSMEHSRLELQIASCARPLEGLEGTLEQLQQALGEALGEVQGQAAAHRASAIASTAYARCAAAQALEPFGTAAVEMAKIALELAQVGEELREDFAHDRRRSDVDSEQAAGALRHFEEEEARAARRLEALRAVHEVAMADASDTSERESERERCAP
ncbi:hypothetical protein T484DRAFT_1774038 [Baffinella frigidus]|nr:hypothetical protein T484DRAFT_1774038 [Cryptophyta sp. CCMP2293]